MDEQCLADSPEKLTNKQTKNNQTKSNKNQNNQTIIKTVEEELQEKRENKKNI